MPVPGMYIRDRRCRRCTRGRTDLGTLEWHARGSTNQLTANYRRQDQRVKRPTISAAGSREEWTYFLTRWQEYVDATQITGKDKVLQLLECCNDNLHKDITPNVDTQPDRHLQRC